LIFPNQKKVFAEWFSGEIKIPQGKMLHYEHMGYISIFEKDLFLEFKKGVLYNKREVDNSKTFDPDDPTGIKLLLCDYKPSEISSGGFFIIKAVSSLLNCLATIITPFEVIKEGNAAIQNS
jgi:hypothetical protein